MTTRPIVKNSWHNEINTREEITEWLDGITSKEIRWRFRVFH